MATQPNEVRRSNFFISQSPSDDEEFPYWTPTDYLERKFAKTNAQVWELVRSRQCVDTYNRNPALVSLLLMIVVYRLLFFIECLSNLPFLGSKTT